MGKLLSQSGLLFPFHQVASILLALRIRVRSAGEKKRWYSVRNDHWLPLLSPHHLFQALRNAILGTSQQGEVSSARSNLDPHPAAGRHPAELHLPPCPHQYQHPGTSTHWQGTSESQAWEGLQCETTALGTCPAGSEVAALGLENYQVGSRI